MSGKRTAWTSRYHGIDSSNIRTLPTKSTDVILFKSILCRKSAHFVVSHHGWSFKTVNGRTTKGASDGLEDVTERVCYRYGADIQLISVLLGGINGGETRSVARNEGLSRERGSKSFDAALLHDGYGEKCSMDEDSTSVRVRTE